jgi:Rod binding domain-containing protein
MQISPLNMPPPMTPLHPPAAGAPQSEKELRKAFDQFVGEAFYGQMLKSMRKTVGKPAYFHGGRGEEVFREHLDQVLSQEMSRSNAAGFSGPMFEQFSMLTRRP